MNIDSLIQTLVVMNLKDISNMSYNQFVYIFLCYLCYSYKEQLVEYISPYILRNRYKSEIINEIKLSYVGKDRDLKIEKTQSINNILWYYVNNTEASKSVESIKQYKLNCAVQRDNEGYYIHDVYLPDTNTTVKIDTDVYLEFIHSCKTIKGKDDTSEEERKILVILKSKYLDCTSLKEWLNDISKSYSEWVNKETDLYLYTTIIEENSLQFSRFVFDSTKNFDNLFFEEKELIIKRLRQYSNIETYKKLGIPHTLGFLFHGEPGCGKTSCIKAMANYLNRSIVSINLKHVNSIEELRKLFLSSLIGDWARDRNKRLYVFEEIDCSVDESENPFLDRKLQKDVRINKEDDNLDKLAKALLKDEKDDKSKKVSCKITTGEVLELLDGIAETDDRIIIFTTNHPEKIDKAFMRPGRIDMCVEFKKLRRVDINNLYKLWFNKSIGEKALSKIKDYSISQAEFGKLCFENNAEKVLEKLISH